MRVRRRGALGVASLLAVLLCPGAGGIAEGAGGGAAATGSISGTVTGNGGEWVDVFAIDTTTLDVVDGALVDADGTYTIDGLPDGDYLVYFGVTILRQLPGYRSDEVWPGSHSVTAAAPVAVVGGGPVTGIDASLDLAGTITGTVTDGGVGVSGALVEVVATDDTATQDGTWYALTDNVGAFSLPGLDVGAYALTVDRDLDEVIDAASGAPIAVGVGESVDAGSFEVTVPAGVPSKPASLKVRGGVGTGEVTFGLPTDAGASPLEYVHIMALPYYFDIEFDDDGIHALVKGVLNGWPSQYAVYFSNAHGLGTARVVSATSEGCHGVWFTDLSDRTAFCGEISWLVLSGFASGYPDATFRATGEVSRQAMAAILHRYADEPAGTEPTCDATQFSDVPASHTFCGDIAWLVEAGIASGFADGSFQPTAPVSRQAMAAFLYRFVGSPLGPEPTCADDAFVDVPTSHPFCGEIQWLASKWIVNSYEDGTFRPGAAVSRQAMAAYLRRMDRLDLTFVGAPPAAAGGAGSSRPESRLPRWSDPQPTPRPTLVRIPIR